MINLLPLINKHNKQEQYKSTPLSPLQQLVLRILRERGSVKNKEEDTTTVEHLQYTLHRLITTNNSVILPPGWTLYIYNYLTEKLP